jgi:transposase
MHIVGVDYHPSFLQIAFLDQETGECGDRRLNHSDGEAEKFYRELRAKGVSVRVGLEATGYSRWFEWLLGELGLAMLRWRGSPDGTGFRADHRNTGKISARQADWQLPRAHSQ